MGRKLLKISIVVLSLLIASASAAEELIQNGGFESGELFPWEEPGDHDAWTVTGSYAFEGAYSGLVRGTYQLAQSFEPRPGSRIEVFSMAVMTALPAWITVEIHYNDEMDPTRANVFVPAVLQWQTLDLLEYVDPDRDVYRVALYGNQNGDSPDDMRTWYDAVTIQNNSPDDDPEDPPCEVEETEFIEARTEKLKMRFNLKKPRTRLAITLLAEEVPEGIESGPVDIRVQLTQGDLTTEFDATAELVEVPHKRDHIIQFMDADSAEP
jgi:hypothetical protein